MSDDIRKFGYRLSEEFGDILRGKVPLPNYEELEPTIGLMRIAAGGGLLARPDVEYALIPGATRGQWARFFLGRTQGGGFDGTGFVIWYDGSKHPAVGRVGTFAICKHTFVMGTGANPSRGWRPGHCSTCGLDMSVDSGD